MNIKPPMMSIKERYQGRNFIKEIRAEQAKKQYTKIRQFYAWVGFIAIIVGLPTIIYMLITLLN